jgi:hypothetical protein
MYFLHLTGKYRFIIMPISVVKRILQYHENFANGQRNGRARMVGNKKS